MNNINLTAAPSKSTLKHLKLIMEIIKAHCTSYPGRTTAAKLLLYLNLKDDEHRQLVQGDVTLIDY